MAVKKKPIKPITPEKLKQLGKGTTDKLKKVKGLETFFHNCYDAVLL